MPHSWPNPWVDPLYPPAPKSLREQVERLRVSYHRVHQEVIDRKAVLAIIDAHVCGPTEAELAAALVKSTLMKRHADYANSLPEMRHGTPEELAFDWAPIILAALAEPKP